MTRIFSKYNNKRKYVKIKIKGSVHRFNIVIITKLRYCCAS